MLRDALFSCGLCLVACALLAHRPAPTVLTFAPEVGTELTRHFVAETEFAIDGLSIAVDGEDLSGMIGDVGFEVAATQNFVVADVVVAFEDGRIQELRREYLELEGESTVDIAMASVSESTDATVSSELTGSEVLFEWDEDLEEYVARAGPDDDIDAALLERLDVGMDLACFLPLEGGEDLEEGDEWEVDLPGLIRFSMLGSRLALEPDQDMPEVDGFDPELFSDMMEDYQDLMTEQMGEWTDGAVRATYRGEREVEGRELAVVELDLELEVDAELSAMIEGMVAGILEQVEVPVEFTLSVDQAHLSSEVSGDGELLWDLEGRHGHSLELSADFEFAMDLELSLSADGESHTFAAEIEGSGLSEQRVDVE